MIQYDLTNTALAHGLRPRRPPSEAELFALTLGLLLNARCGFAALSRQTLVLTASNYLRVAQLLEERAPALASELGDPRRLRRRLRELIGISVVDCAALS